MQFCLRIIPTIILITLLLNISCSKNEQRTKPSQQVLKKYLECSMYTDPGEFEYLYDSLPESIEDLCDIIKKQLIHPFDIKKYGGRIPANRPAEDRSIPSVRLMLKELLARDSNGLSSSRQPENRLVVACVHHSLLLASILRHQGVPVRLRAGNAKYISDDDRVRVSHAICEVWDAHRNVWFLVDPDRHRIDFNPREFEFASETWQKLRTQTIKKKYYISRYESVDQATAHLLCLDLSYVVGVEEPYWDDPPIVTKIDNSLKDISDTELQLLDKIAALLKDPDQHLDKLINTKADNNSLNHNREL